MLNNLILAGTLILAFFMCISAFILGVKVGKQLGNNQVPTVNLNPIKAVTNAIEKHEQKKESEKLDDELQAILGATKESMLEAVKKER
jgi:hypothetical protein